MNAKLRPDRRRFTAGLSAALAAGSLPWARVHAQPLSKVIVFMFPGAVAEVLKEYYVRGFTENTGIEARLATPPGDPFVWFKTRRTEFNVSIGNPTAVLLYQDGNLESLRVDDFPVLKSIPQRFQTSLGDGVVTGIPIYYQFYGIAINTDLVSPSDFQSWHDLAAPKWKGKVGGGGYAAMYELPWFGKLLAGDESALEPSLKMHKAILANALTIPRSLVQANQMLRSGEIVAMPYYSGQVATLRAQGATNVRIVIPKEGGVIIPYQLTIPKAAFELAAAKQFVAWCGEPPNVDQVMEKAGILPVNAEIGLPRNLDKLLGGITATQLETQLHTLDWNKVVANLKPFTAAAQQAAAAVR